MIPVISSSVRGRPSITAVTRAVVTSSDGLALRKAAKPASSAHMSSRRATALRNLASVGSYDAVAWKKSA